MRRTRIVCTIGPASRDPLMLGKLVGAGMDVARLNFSHGTHEEHAAAIRAIREGEAGWGHPVTIIQDLQGPKIRLGNFVGGRAMLIAGEPFVLTAETVPGTAARASLDEPNSSPRSSAATRSGWTTARSSSSSSGWRRARRTAASRPAGSCPTTRVCRCRGCPCRSPVSRPRTRTISASASSTAWTTSPCRSCARPPTSRRCASSLDQRASLPIIAKLERAEIVANLPGILALVDAVMVARGDLGLEVPLEEVPIIQRDVIRQARLAKVPVIVATQMLESMVTYLRPTRAEVTDVATAILRVRDAILLSPRTARVSTQWRRSRSVAVAARASARPRARTCRPPRGVRFAEAVAESPAGPERVHARHRCLTQSGFSARASPRAADVPVVAPRHFRKFRAAPYWGSAPASSESGPRRQLRARRRSGDGTVRNGDVIVIISGAPMWVTGTTNLLKLHRVGDRR